MRATAQRAQLVEMRLGHLERLARVKIGLRAAPGLQVVSTGRTAGLTSTARAPKRSARCVA